MSHGHTSVPNSYGRTKLKATPGCVCIFNSPSVECRCFDHPTTGAIPWPARQAHSARLRIRCRMAACISLQGAQYSSLVRAVESPLHLHPTESRSRQRFSIFEARQSNVKLHSKLICVLYRGRFLLRRRGWRTPTRTHPPATPNCRDEEGSGQNA